MFMIQNAFNLFLQASFSRRIVAVTNRFDEHVLQTLPLKSGTEDIEYSPVKRLALCFKFVAQHFKYCRFSSSERNQVPKMAHFVLADTMNTAKALFNTIGV